MDILALRVKPPSGDDWQSTGAAGGRAGLGILAHSVLPRTFELALPNWASMFLFSVISWDACNCANDVTYALDCFAQCYFLQMSMSSVCMVLITVHLHVYMRPFDYEMCCA